MENKSGVIRIDTTRGVHTAERRWTERMTINEFIQYVNGI